MQCDQQPHALAALSCSCDGQNCEPEKPFLPSAVPVRCFVMVIRRAANTGLIPSTFISVSCSPLLQHSCIGLLYFLQIKPWSYFKASHTLFPLPGTPCPQFNPSSGSFTAFRSEIRGLPPSQKCLSWLVEGGASSTPSWCCVPKTYSLSLS